MDKRIPIIMFVIVILLALIGSYFAFTPHYKIIEMSGYTFEVPQSNAEVKNNTVNYNTYLDTEYDLNIKSWACKDTNDINSSLNASHDIRNQLLEYNGTNMTYKNISLLNKSGVYTYYDEDIENSCVILITTKNLDEIEHILDTMKKPSFNVSKDQFDMASSSLILSNPENNTTIDNQTNTAKTSAKKSSGSKKKSGAETIYMEGDPEANGEYKGVGEGIYRNTKTGKVYTQKGRNKFVRSPELDNSPYLLG